MLMFGVAKAFAIGCFLAQSGLTTSDPVYALQLEPPDGSIIVVEHGDSSVPSSAVGLSVKIPGSGDFGQSSNTHHAGDKPGPKSQKNDSARPAVCVWYTLDDPPESPRWAGHSIEEGHLEALRCGATTNDGTGMGSNLLDYRFVPTPPPNQPAPPPPPPDPAVLAQEAIGQLTVPPPTVGAGPDRTKIAVNLWTWLWVDDPGPLTATVAAAGVSVTATATLASVTWSLGEPEASGTAFSAGPPATVTCDGAGVAPTPADDWKSEPPCGYQFHWRSTKERTGGTGTWPITATSNWDVTWQSNTGVTGATTLAATANDAFDVGEYRTVLVQQPDG